MQLLKISSIKYIDKKQTYNLSMAGDDHNFILSNGIISGNSHAISYSYITYLTAYMKTNYPAEFICSCLTSNFKEPDKVNKYLNYCRTSNIKILPPDINESKYTFSIDKNNNIRFGLSTIKHVGNKVIREVILERKKNGLFTDIINFCSRTEHLGLDKGILEALVLAGAFDSLHNERADVLDAIVDIWRYRDEYKKWESKLVTFEKKLESYLNREQERLQGIKKPSLKKPIRPEKPRLPEVLQSVKPLDELYKLQKEEELIGFYITGHPLNFVNNSKLPKNLVTIGEIKDLYNNDKCSFVAIPSIIKEITTKKKDKMAYVSVEDTINTIDLTVFPKTWAKTKDRINNKIPSIFIISVEKLEDDNEEFNIVKGKLIDIIPVEIFKEKQSNINFSIKINNLEQSMKDIKKLINNNSLNTINLTIELDKGNIVFPLKTDQVSQFQRLL